MHAGQPLQENTRKQALLQILRQRFADADLWNGWTADAPSALMNSMKDFPAEILRKMDIVPANRVVMLTATSKRVRALLAQMEWPLQAHVRARNKQRPYDEFSPPERDLDSTNNVMWGLHMCVLTTCPLSGTSAAIEVCVFQR